MKNQVAKGRAKTQYMPLILAVYYMSTILLLCPFPVPAATPEQQAAHATLTLTDLYNVVEKLKAGEALTPKDQTIN